MVAHGNYREAPPAICSSGCCLSVNAKHCSPAPPTLPGEEKLPENDIIVAVIIQY